jgi:spore coat polysaccharide biosynthesis predicted glycosyltransferase SpsG/RimJ/RimL family protein N-acetyltransferase
VDVVEGAAGWEHGAEAWTVLDGYQFGVQDQQRVVDGGGRLLVIDDHGSVGHYVADAVLDQNLGAAAASYRDRAEGTELLLGPRYALLRREFRAVPDRKSEPARAERVLVSLGGDPPREASERVNAAVSSLDLSVDWLSGARRVAEAMAAADLAISGAGVTAWELCAVGTPAVLVALADNQRPVAAALADAGAAVSTDLEHLPSVLGRLVVDREGRQRMSDVARGIVDGRGARRVVAWLIASLIELRLAQQSDARQLWEWANEPFTRAMSFSQTAIPWEDHLEWFMARVSSPATRLFVGSLGGRPIGQARFDLGDGQAEIAISLDAAERGRGRGAALVAAATRHLFGETDVERVVARVRPENDASVRTFVDAGYAFDGTGSDGQHEWLRYSRSRNDG